MLSDQNVEAELSYAYLHAVAARAGFGCEVAGRHSDGAGVDAVVREAGRFLAADSVYDKFALEVQLKATRVPPVEQNGRYSFRLPVHQYDRLRSPYAAAPLVLVVLFLPPDPTDWLAHSEGALIARRCAYWVSLRRAPASGNAEYQTVYIPRSQPLSVESLTDIMTRCSREEEIRYAVG